MLPPASDYYQSGLTGHTYHRRLASLRAICKKWRTIIDDTPAFWPVLDVSDPPRIVSRAIEHSAAYHLEVNLARPSWYLTPRALDSSWRESFLRDAVQHVARWRSAQLTLPDGQTLLSIAQESAPRLTAMDLRLDQLEALDEEDAKHIFQCSDGQLRRLGLYSLVIPWHSSLLCGLQSLSLSDLDDFAPTLTQILGIIRGCPNMVDLELDVPKSEAVALPKDEPLLQLLSLKSAKLSLNEECALSLLNLLLVPFVDTFQLNTDFGLCLPSIFHCLGRLITFDAPTLMILTIKEDTIGWCVQPMTQTPGQSRQVGLVADVADSRDAVRTWLKHVHKFGADCYEVHVDSVNAAALDISPVLEELRPLENVGAVHVRNCDTEKLYSYMLSHMDPWDCGFPAVKKLVLQNCRIWPQRLLEVVEDRYVENSVFEDVVVSDPIDQDADAFRDIISGPDATSKRLSYLDDYVKVINSTVDRVRDRLFSKVSILNKERNTLVPLHQLPIERLLDILRRSLYLDSHPTRTMGQTYHQRLAKHRTVCKQWRTIIDDTPSLWATLDVRDPPEIISMAITRSAAYPLEINLGPNTWYPRRRGHGSTRRSIFLQDTVQHSDRWRSARLTFRTLQDFLSISQTPAPRLRSLDLNLTNPATLDFESSETIFQCQEGQLRELALSGLAIPWNSRLLRGLGSLSIRGLAELAPMCPEILGMLQECPHLTDLDLDATWSEVVALPKRNRSFNFYPSLPSC
ncbi:hypothetical protein FRB90_011449 [Tulasnella sp. 427]|nr:hypothetical protein FRB90_011449 [Tulasnella sp. 427]